MRDEGLVEMRISSMVLFDGVVLLTKDSKRMRQYDNLQDSLTG